MTVLGNGHQKKSYLHVLDCIRSIDLAVSTQTANVNIFNLGVDGFCEVRDSVGWIVDELGLSPETIYGTESKGWIGDNPLIHLDTTKIRSIGWEPKFSIEESIRDTVNFMKANKWIFGRSA